jgi:hypothetical protein
MARIEDGRVLVEAAQVMFSDVDPQSVGAVLIAARKLQG